MDGTNVMGTIMGSVFLQGGIQAVLPGAEC